MAIRCSRCGREYDVTLFEFGRTLECECGAEVDAGRPHRHHVGTLDSDGAGEAPEETLPKKTAEPDQNASSK